VLSFERYISKLNPDNTAFWQLPCDTFNEQDPVGYTHAPLGKNALSNLMSNISKLANLSMNYTNHSIRATSITEMDEAGVASRHIMRISGHESETSIKNYSNRLSDKKRGKYLTVLPILQLHLFTTRI
jgi:integrase